jgi:putative methyltransferase (TIGR04325 family)
MRKLVLNLVARIPVVREQVAKKIFLGPNHNTHRLMGIFSSYAEAMAHIPNEFEEGPEESKAFLNFCPDIQESDLPVVRILSGLMPGIKTVFDLGGNVGLCFYQFRSRIPYPPALRWTIHDLPLVNEAGRKVALERGETQLAFTDNRKDANGTDVYLTTGTLQYLDKPLAYLLGELKKKPRHLLVNRVPMTEHQSFYTLQHSGHRILPYYYANHAGFISSIEALGYKLVETWKLGRGSEIILHPEQDVKNYYGLYFVRD